MDETRQQETQVPPKQKRRRWVLRLVIALCVVLPIAALVGHYLITRDSLNRELQAAIDDLDQNDPGWRLEEIEANRPPLADKDNAALKVIVVWRKLPKSFTNDLAPSGHPDLSEVPPTVQLSAQQIRTIRTGLKKVKTALLEARKLRNYPTGRYKINWTKDVLSTLLPDIQNARGVAFLLQNDVFLLVHDKKSEQAWRSCESLYRVGTSLGNLDNLVILLVRFACRAIALQCMERVLAQGEVNGAALAETQKMLENDLRERILWKGLRGERAGMHRLFVGLENGEVSLDALAGTKKRGPRSSSSSGLGISALWVIPRVQAGHVYYLKFISKMVEAAKLPPTKKLKRFADLDNEFQTADADKSLPVLGALLIPGVVKVAEADIRIDTQTNCAVCALACERYRLKHNQWPDKLSTLVKEKLIAKVPIDPYDGKPLRYKQTKNGVIVYSVGKDKSYKGEALDNPAMPVPPVRIEFRLWNPDRRRQPARLKQTDQNP